MGLGRAHQIHNDWGYRIGYLDKNFEDRLGMEGHCHHRPMSHHWMRRVGGVADGGGANGQRLAEQRYNREGVGLTCKLLWLHETMECFQGPDCPCLHRWTSLRSRSGGWDQAQGQIELLRECPDQSQDQNCYL